MQQVTPGDSVPNDMSRFGIGIDMSSGTAEEAADRALTGVSRKLDKSLSVEYTVNDLIAEATDPYNLASIFFGAFLRSSSRRHFAILMIPPCRVESLLLNMPAPILV